MTEPLPKNLVGGSKQSLRLSSAKPRIDEKPEPHFYSWRVSDLAEALRKPRQYVYDHKNKIPHRKLGRELRFDPKEIERWWKTLPGCPLKIEEEPERE